MVTQLLQRKALNPNVAFEALHGLVPIAPSSLASLYIPGDPASASVAAQAYLYSLLPWTFGSCCPSRRLPYLQCLYLSRLICSYLNHLFNCLLLHLFLLPVPLLHGTQRCHY